MKEKDILMSFIGATFLFCLLLVLVPILLSLTSNTNSAKPAPTKVVIKHADIVEYTSKGDDVVSFYADHDGVYFVAMDYDGKYFLAVTIYDIDGNYIDKPVIGMGENHGETLIKLKRGNYYARVSESNNDTWSMKIYY